MTRILCTVNLEMPWHILVWVPGSDIYLCQETLYRSESCKRKIKKTLACRPPRMATQVHQACHRRYWHYVIACRSTWLLSSALSPRFCLGVIIGMPNMSCILELRANQCLVCSFFRMPTCRCKCQIAEKIQCLSCFRRDFRNMLTPFQIVCSSNSKVFDGLNLFQMPKDHVRNSIQFAYILKA